MCASGRNNWDMCLELIASLTSDFLCRGGVYLFEEGEGVIWREKKKDEIKAESMAAAEYTEI